MFFGTDDAGLEKLQKEFLEINNLVIEGQPEDLVINTHICRGTSIPPGPAPVLTIRSRSWYLERKRSAPCIWNLTMHAPADLNA